MTGSPDPWLAALAKSVWHGVQGEAEASRAAGAREGWVIPLTLMVLAAGCQRGGGGAARAAVATKREQPVATQPAKASGVQFVDVAKQSGLVFKHCNGHTEQRRYIEAFTGGGGFIDYDNDGYLDVYLITGAPVAGSHNVFFRNNGNGTFTDMTKSAGLGFSGYGLGMCVGDYDNDGYDDIYLTNYGPNKLLHNNGDGTFTDVTAKAGVGDPHLSTSAAFLDYDRDGYLDLYVCNYIQYQLGKEPRCSPKPGIFTYCGPEAFLAAPDVLYHNNGDGTFTDVTKKAGIIDVDGKGLGVAVGDYDNDGWPDIYVANDRTPNFLFHNNRDGTFTEVGLQTECAYNENGVEEAGMGTDFGDYDNDGWLDLIVTNFSQEHNTLYHNSGHGSFADVTMKSGLGEATYLKLGFGTCFFDYDNDGWQDLFFANGHVMDNAEQVFEGVTYRQPPQLFRNNAHGVFADISSQAGPAFAQAGVARAAAFGDYDNDGDTDILMVNLNDWAELLRNDGGNRNNWLTFKCVGRKSNRDGIGARIEVVAGGLRRIREVRSGSSYLAANDLRVNFGLGTNVKADAVRIRWPSGLVEELKGVEARRLVTLKEGAAPQGKASFQGGSRQ